MALSFKLSWFGRVGSSGGGGGGSIRLFLVLKKRCLMCGVGMEWFWADR
jgi:hypothetical protein